jgi:ABC-type uncharacterized transport system involved in gliding motility auxiliary subunit
MKQKKFETLLYSTIGVAVMFVIIVAVNFITGTFKTRIDMTEEKLYTLDPGTRAILKKLDSPVEIRFYFSQSESRMPSGFKTYGQHVEDLLSEFKQAGRGNVVIKKFDPKPDSDAEDLANLDGIEAQMLPTGDHMYLGIAVSQDPAKAALPFLPPERERLLEYDLARAIAQVSATNKPVIGVMTPLPMFGSQIPPQLAMRTGQQSQEPWVFIQELKRDFEVKQVPMDTEKIDDDIRVLLVAHPKDIKDSAQYAIDQFVMRGGKLIAFLDAMSLADSRQQNPMMGMMPGGASSLDKLLKAWGIQFENTKVAADLNFARQLRGPNNQPQTMPAFLFLDAKGINKEDTTTTQLDEVLLPFAGVFTGTPVAGLKQTVLLKTTADAQLVDGFMAQMSGQKIVDEFKPSGTSYALAVRLTGKFKTAFPDGKPASQPDKDEDKKDEKKEEKPKPEDQIKESKAENSVVLVGDSDFVFDNFCAQVQNFFGQKIVIPRFGNLTLAQSMVEQMAGDSNLIGVRSRATLNRPFTVVKEMQKQANLRFQAEIKKLEEEQAEAQKRLNELQAKKEAGQRFILSKEQQDEIAKFKQKEAEARKQLKLTRKNLRQEIDSLENRLKWANIAGMPVLVTIAGLALAVLRKRKTKAR